jgi:Flp pilus assembly protein TadG
MLNLRAAWHCRHTLHRFGRRASVALEFALVAPVLVVLLFGVYEISEGMIIYEEVFNAARVMAASASSASVQADNSTKLYYGQIQLQASSIFAQIPALRSGFENGIKSITISSVNFEVDTTQPACTPGVANCYYLPYVVWSVAYTGGDSGRTFQTVLRTCATQATTSPYALITSSALNQGTPTGTAVGNLAYLRTFNISRPDPTNAPPDPIIVVDIHFQYMPLLRVFVKNPIDFWADGYWPLRSVQATSYNAVNGTFTKLQSDQQFTGIASTGTKAGNGITTYTIPSTLVYPPGSTVVAGAPTASTYCISTYYPEPSS